MHLMSGSKITIRGKMLKGVGDSSREKGAIEDFFEVIEWLIKENLAKRLEDGRNLGLVSSL